jgi:hypothetical protein
MEATDNLRKTGYVIKSVIQITNDESNVYGGLEKVLTRGIRNITRCFEARLRLRISHLQYSEMGCETDALLRPRASTHQFR